MRKRPAEATAGDGVAPGSAKRMIGKPMMFGDRVLPLSAGAQANGSSLLSGPLGTDAAFQLAGEAAEALRAEAGFRLAEVFEVTASIAEAPLSTGFNRVYAEYFFDAPPARSTVIRGLLPGTVLAIAALPSIAAPLA